MSQQDFWSIEPLQDWSASNIPATLEARVLKNGEGVSGVKVVLLQRLARDPLDPRYPADWEISAEGTSESGGRVEILRGGSEGSEYELKLAVMTS